MALQGDERGWQLGGRDCADDVFGFHHFVPRLTSISGKTSALHASHKIRFACREKKRYRVHPGHNGIWYKNGGREKNRRRGGIRKQNTAVAQLSHAVQQVRYIGNQKKKDRKT